MEAARNDEGRVYQYVSVLRWSYERSQRTAETFPGLFQFTCRVWRDDLVIVLIFLESSGIVFKKQVDS